MTNLEFHELTKALNIYSLKEQNSCKICDIIYTYKNGRIIATGKIPVNVIQELSMLPGSKNCFLDLLLTLSNRDGEYFKKIEISNFKDFVLLFQYMEDYNLSKRGLNANGKDLCDDIIKEIIENVYNNVNLYITNEDWMRQKYCLEIDKYQQYIKKLSKKPLFKTEKAMAEYDCNLNIRKNIDNFDLCVNPYINNASNLKKIYSMDDNLIISIDNLDLGSEGAMLKVIDKNTHNYIKYERTNTSFCYEVGYSFRGEVNIFKHYFEINNSKCDKTGVGERIVIIQSNKNDKRNKNTIFNITTNQIIDDNNVVRPITVEEKSKIYDEILASTAYAEEISSQMINSKKYTVK